MFPELPSVASENALPTHGGVNAMHQVASELQKSAAQRVTLYPVAGLAGAWEDEPFDRSQLPATIVPGVTLEDVSSMFNDDTWKWVEHEIGRHDLKVLEGVKHALVHRYLSTEYGTGEAEMGSARVVHEMAACLRLIRPMRQFALIINGPLRPDGVIQIQSFDHPVHLMEIPEVQKGFTLRDRDLRVLQSVAPQFVRAMAGEYWKFRMPVSLYEAGHFQDSEWKARFSLWTSAIEAIFTSQTRDREHSGSAVAKARIKWFLGENTKIYAQGDVPSFMPPQMEPTIGEIVDDLYEVRNCIAHGDKVPNKFFGQPSFSDQGNKLMTLEEAASFIVRTSLLRILSDGLLPHFKGGLESQAYFRAHGLVRSQLPKQKS
jgi:hypothetical protein